MFRRQILVRLYDVYFIGVSDSKKFLTIHEVNAGITSMSQLVNLVQKALTYHLKLNTE